MAFGPVQLIVLGFPNPNFQGEIVEELQRLRDADMVRVIDALAVYKQADGDVKTLHFNNLTIDEQVELGAKIGALVGLGAFGDTEAAEEMAVDAAQIAADEGIEVFPEAVWDALGEIPPDTAAALILLEHHWAVPLRDAIARAGGFRVGDGFISPFDLVAIGEMTIEEARAQEMVASA